MSEETISASDVGAMPEGIVEAPAVDVPPAPERTITSEAAAPTLDEAFHTLCKALYPLLEDDIPSQMHSNDIRAMYEDGNRVIGWTHAVMLLEQVLGQKVTPA
jgi:hypothetical protein